MKLIFNKIDSGFYRVDTEKEHNGRNVYPTVATIEQNSYGRKLWQVNIEGRGRLVDSNGFDCFTLAIAKQEIKARLIG